MGGTNQVGYETVDIESTNTTRIDETTSLLMKPHNLIDKYHFSKKNIKYFSMVWLLVTVLVPINLYLDYNCSNIITPADYFYEPENILTSVNAYALNVNNTSYECISNKDCGHGTCKPIKTFDDKGIGSECICEPEYETIDYDICKYHKLSGLAVLLISICVGGCGIDLCFIARGNSCFICCGILKGLTCGGCGIWYITNIVLFAMGEMNDGNGRPIGPILAKF